jgi:hypothetical protein
MDKRALAVLLVLTTPLLMYGIPYAAAATSSSDYVVTGSKAIGESIFLGDNLLCNTGDYALSGGYKLDFVSDVASVPKVASSYPTVAGAPATAGQTPNGWAFDLENPTAITTTFSLWVVCQTPITVAGVGVPEFGSLYAAIAVGAIVYFLVARRYSPNKGAAVASSQPA